MSHKWSDSKTRAFFKSIYHYSGISFIISAYYHILRNKLLDNNSRKKYNISKPSQKTPNINSLHDMIHVLHTADSKIYGETNLQGFDDDPSKTILLISHELSLSGAPIVLYHLASLLKGLNYQTIIICSSDNPTFGEYVARNGIPVIIYPKLMESEFILRIRRLFSKIIVNTILCAPVIKLLINTDSNVIWWIHESRSCYDRSIAKITPRKVSKNIHIYAVGAYARRELLKRHPLYTAKNLLYYSPIIPVIHDNNSEHLRNNNSHKKKKRYSIIAGLTYRKGQDILIKAIDLLPKEVINGSVFSFAGFIDDEPIYEKLNNLIDRYPDNVEYLGVLQREDIYKLYDNTDFLICPSRDDPMPVVIVEAASAGIPSICSSNTGSAAIIKHFKAGTVYNNNSARKLAKQIVRTYYIDNKDLKIMSHNAKRMYLNAFSKRHSLKKIISIL